MTGEETTRVLRELSGSNMVEVTINDEPRKSRVERETPRSASGILYSRTELRFGSAALKSQVLTIHLNLKGTKGTKEAVELFLYHIVKKALPRNDLKQMSTEQFSMLLSQLWCLGSQLIMSSFQDEVMMELLKVLRYEAASRSVIKYTF